MQFFLTGEKIYQLVGVGDSTGFWGELYDPRDLLHSTERPTYRTQGSLAHCYCSFGKLTISWKKSHPLC